MLCFNGNKSSVLISDARGVNARLLVMFITRHHVKHMLNYEYLTAALIYAWRTRVGKCDQVIKYSATILSSFSQCFMNLCNNSDQT